MQWLGEVPSPSVCESLGLVIERVLEQGASKPKAWIFLDRDGRWQDATAGLSLAERRSCVAIALNDQELVDAARWSIGGGVYLPPSVLRVSAACRAAGEASALPSWIADPETVSEFSTRKNVLTVALKPADLWQTMVGLRGQLELLGALAEALERPAVIGPGPSLSLGGSDRVAIETAWENLATRPQWAAGGYFLDFGDSDLSVTDDIKGRWWPVALWPSAKVVARWKLDAANTTCPWRLETDRGVALQTEAVCTQAELERSNADIVRIHRVLSSEIEREGSPGAVVIEALARRADRSGHTLWIPGVSPVAGAVIRRWGLGVWVDGLVLKGRDPGSGGIDDEK